MFYIEYQNVFVHRLIVELLLIVLEDAIDDGDGVFTYEFPFTFISFGRIDTSFSSNDILLPSLSHALCSLLFTVTAFV